MKPMELKSVSIDQVVENSLEDQRIYDALTSEERDEVDRFNAQIRGRSITEIIALGDHPMKQLRKKYKKA